MRYINNDNNFIKNKLFKYQKKFLRINKKFTSNYLINNKTLFYVLGLKENKQKTIINFMKKIYKFKFFSRCLRNRGWYNTKLWSFYNNFWSRFNKTGT